MKIYMIVISKGVKEIKTNASFCIRVIMKLHSCQDYIVEGN